MGLFRLVSPDNPIKIYFIDNEYYFGRPGIYGFSDDGERYAYFSKAVLESISRLPCIPDVIHCHDWQTALIPFFIHAEYARKYGHIPTVFTIHNIEYQGKCEMHFYEDVLGEPDLWKNALTFDNHINCLKGGIELADGVTTVSKTYAEELKYPFFAHGLADIIKRHEKKLVGIVNGIDPDLYDPVHLTGLAANYSANDLSGKAINKEALQKELGLDVNPDVPLIVIISRLVPHKGLELIRYVWEDFLTWDCQLAILGTGYPEYEDMFRKAAKKHPGKVSATFAFDSRLANRMYAGADIFLMPSKSEPCGLSQLIAMRYGTVPVVREVGGLRDTVPTFSKEEKTGRGFTFQSYNAHDMLDAIGRAIACYFDKETWKDLIKTVMEADTSWNASAEEYMKLYQTVRKN